MELIRVTIPTWEKFNPRKDRANYTWFRVDNDFFENPDVFPLDGDTQRVFLRIISLASKENSPNVRVFDEQIASVLRIPAAKVREAVGTLTESGLLVRQDAVKAPAESRQDAGEQPSLSLATIRDERDERYVGPPPDSETQTQADPNTAEIPGKYRATTECLWEHPDLREFLEPVPIAGQKAWVAMVGTRFLIEPELHRARAWWVNNRERRKPGDTVARFVNGWLNGALEKLAKEKPEAARDAPTAAYAPTPGFGGGLKACEQDKADMRAAPADPKRVRDIVARVTGKM